MRIIYTPNALQFCLQEYETLFPQGRYLHDCRSQRLRQNFSKLRDAFPDLENRVGVVTYNDLKRKAAKIGGFEIEGAKSTFLPLEILEQAIKLKDEDRTNSLAREYVYRQLGYLLSHTCFGSGPHQMLALTPMVEFAIQTGQSIKHASQGLNALMQTESSVATELAELAQTASLIQKTYDLLGETLNFERIDAFYERYRKSFESNKVSRTFPLTYISKDNITPDIATVDLEEKTDVPDFMRSLFEGDNEKARAKATNIGCLIDHFGATEYHPGFESMLKQLPSSKTIITDTYPVTLFGQIASENFTTHEFPLDKQ